MILYPAIDLFEGCAVRLYKGDYAQMTRYGDPVDFARRFAQAGASWLHLVDLEGAKAGQPQNLETIRAIIKETGMRAELGGGIRDLGTIEKCLEAGVSRVILGTAALENPEFLQEALQKWGKHIAVGVDMKNGCVAVRGWTETSATSGEEFCRKLETMGVQTLIVTDISRDGAMQGANHALYGRLKEHLKLDIIASGGVTTLDDLRALAALDLHGAILGKAYYSGAIAVEDALEAVK